MNLNMMYLQYNSKTEKLIMPEYGRLVQKMAFYAKTIKDKKQRQAYAEKIIKIMGYANLKIKNQSYFQQKLWDHLAYITDYELEIDYPIKITKIEKSYKPSKHMNYPQSYIKYKHYGRLIEKFIQQLQSLPDSKEKKILLLSLANKMKRNLASWKKNGVTDEKVSHDLQKYSDGLLSI